MKTRVFSVLFLTFVLSACQPAPATPTLDPMLQPSAAPPATATIVRAPTDTQAAIPTATTSPEILKQQAGQICEDAFSALVESGPLTPPFAVMKKETGIAADTSMWELSAQLPHVSSLSAQEVKTLFCISESRTQTGTYTDGSAAYQLFWDIRAVSLPAGKVIGRNFLAGAAPPKTKVLPPESTEGLTPDQEFSAWVFNRLDHPNFLYFEDAITSLAISPNGRLAAFGTAIANEIVDKNYRAKIFLFNPSDLQTDLGTSAFLDVLDGHQGMVTSLAFSPDGKVLVSSGYDLFIKFWDMPTGRLLGQASLPDTPNFLAFTSDGSKLAVASNLEVSLFDPDSMQIERSIPEVAVDALAFSPDGLRLYVHTSKNIKIIDTSANRVTLQFPDPLALIPTISVAADGTVLSVSYETPNAVNDFVLSPEGTQIITYTVDPLIRSDSGQENVRLAAWDANTGKFIRESRFAGGSPGAMKLAPDGNLLALVNDREIWLWDTATWQLIKKRSGHSDLIEDLVFTPDGARILSAGRDGTVRVWALDE